MELYSYYRSTAAYRVRIALNYKKIPFKIIPVDLIGGKHKQKDYLQHNQQGRVPTLNDNGFEIGQSMAILEYLEETFPKPALLPADPKDRAWVRYLAQIIVSDTHPLNNSSVIKYLDQQCQLDKAKIQVWYEHWVRQAFICLEKLLCDNKKRGKFCFGDTPTFADICLIPQIYNAYRFNIPLDEFPTLKKINKDCLDVEYFDNARPERQPDYQPERENTTVP